MRRWQVAALVVSGALAACGGPTDPCGEAASGKIRLLDVVGALMATGAQVEDRGEVLASPTLGVAARDLRVNGVPVRWYEYCTPAAAEADARRFSADASTLDGVAVHWAGRPHVWALGQVILIYEGEDRLLLDLLDRIMGPPVAEGA